MNNQNISTAQPLLVNKDARPKSLYRVAATMALLIVLAGLADTVTSLGVEAHDNRTIAITDWFSLFQSDRFAAFSRLGLFNIITLSLGIPIYLAFNQVFRERHRSLTAFASILFFIGTAVYLASNTVFSLFALSQQYATASAAQKPMLEAAGQALLAQGADLTPGTFLGLFFTQVAGMFITSVLLWDGVFGKWTGGIGLAGFALMSVFFVLTAFVRGRYRSAIMISAPGGMLLMAVQLMLAYRFLQISR
jgi:hypothetical protein